MAQASMRLRSPPVSKRWYQGGKMQGSLCGRTCSLPCPLRETQVGRRTSREHAARQICINERTAKQMLSDSSPDSLSSFSFLFFQSSRSRSLHPTLYAYRFSSPSTYATGFTEGERG